MGTGGTGGARQGLSPWVTTGGRLNKAVFRLNKAVFRLNCERALQVARFPDNEGRFKTRFHGFECGGGIAELEIL